jgi:dynein heavy chain
MEAVSDKRSRLATVRLGDADFMRRFENAIPLGHSVLLEGVNESLDPVLTPLLERRVISQRGSQTIEFGEGHLDYGDGFKLYILCKHANPHFLPEVSSLVTVINFAITFQGLKDQLLD